MDVDVNIVWDAMTTNIPPLKKKINKILTDETSKKDLL